MLSTSRSQFAVARYLVATACLLVSVLQGAASWAQTPINTLAATTHMAPARGAHLRIAAGTTYAGTITITSDSVTITNYGTLAGTIVVSSGVKGTVLHNLGSVTSQTIYLNAPTTINNGSDGTTIAVSASWTGYIGDTFGAAPTINNFAHFAGEIYNLPGGTIHNQRGAIWSGYIHDSSAALTITNDGTWQASLTTTGSLRVLNNGLWNSFLVSHGPAAITNLGAWPTREAGHQVAAR